jgi:hypothetical protein
MRPVSRSLHVMTTHVTCVRDQRARRVEGRVEIEYRGRRVAGGGETPSSPPLVTPPASHHFISSLLYLVSLVCLVALCNSIVEVIHALDVWWW